MRRRGRILGRAWAWFATVSSNDAFRLLTVVGSPAAQEGIGAAPKDSQSMRSTSTPALPRKSHVCFRQPNLYCHSTLTCAFDESMIL